jgi:hypothetical protein
MFECDGCDVIDEIWPFRRLEDWPLGWLNVIAAMMIE